MSSFSQALSDRLDDLRARGLYRELRRVDSAQGTVLTVDGRKLLNFSSNDYLGLAGDPLLKAAAIQAVERFGAGAGASRLISGSLSPHHQLEEALAEFKKTEASLTFATGYAAALGTICALAGKDDVVVVDKLVHACLVDAARLSGAKLRVFPHNDLNRLEEILKWSQAREGAGTKSHTLVVTESVFSMDGGHAPLREIVDLKDRYGAWLMVDEAHATGLYGDGRRGLAEEMGISARIEIQMGTLGKALGASGGYICGCRRLIDFLVNRARTFIFSTAPVPSAAAAATAGVEFVRSRAGEERCRSLWERAGELSAGIFHGKASVKSAIVPLILGDEGRAMAAAAALRERDIYVPAIRFPTVARGAARLRLTLTAVHTKAQVSQLADELKALGLVYQTPLPSESVHASIR